MATHHLKRRDTAPAFEATLTDAAGDVVSLVGASVLFKLKNTSDGVVKVNAAATITDANAGEVEYQQSASDVDIAGRFLVEWEVTYADARVQTFPTISYNILIVHADLDPA